MITRAMIIAAVWLAAVSVAGANEGSSTISGEYTYLNAQRTFSSNIKNGFWFMEPIVSKTSHGRKNDTAPEFTSSDAVDCSDELFLCAGDAVVVMAIPRKGLSKKMAYELRGVNFSLVECLRSEGEECQVAIMVGDCQHQVPTGYFMACQTYSAGRNSSPSTGPVTYFIYNQDYGVTSFGISVEVLSDRPAIDLAARQYILQGEVGLLKPSGTAKPSGK